MTRPLRKRAGQAAQVQAAAETEPVPAAREARLEIRLTREQKALLTRAAATEGVSVAEFVRKAVHDAALEIVSEHDVLRLCVEDQYVFAAALLDPPVPNEYLKALFRDYFEWVKS